MSLSLAGAIDTHVHTAPDVVPRIQTDLELVQSARDAGIRAVILKNHHFPTADRASLAQTCFSQIEVFGGIVLNAAAGGLNPSAVMASIAVGGRIVWLPTTSASNHHRYARTNSEAVPVTPIEEVTQGGVTTAELDPILDLIAAADIVLATGHLAPEEIVATVSRAQERGVRRIVVTHPELPIVDMPVETQRSLAAKGVFFERCYYSVLGGLPIRRMVDQIRAVGVDSTILSTDLGQPHNPTPVEGLRAFGELLISAGITETEWWQMTRLNPARLLGLDRSE